MDDKKTSVSIAFWDRAGIAISGFCAAHCLFFPITVALLPLWPAAEWLHQWTHPLLFFLIAPTVMFAVQKSDNRRQISLFLYSGLVIVAAPWALHYWIGDWGESFITVVGSALLVTGHWLNYKYHKKRN